MKSPRPRLSPRHHGARSLPRPAPGQLLLALAGALMGAPLARAEWVEVISEGFETQPAATTSLADTADADPVAPLVVTDDDPLGSPAGSGVEVAGWSAKSGTKSLLVRSGSEAILQLLKPRSGTKYQVDFHINSSMGAGDRNFYVILRSEGLDNNGDDFLAYRADRANSKQLFYFQGIGQAIWTAVEGKERTEGSWQHHRFIIDMVTQTYDLYIDDLITPAVTGALLSRPGAPVPTAIILRNEGNSADDGHFLIDDISVKAEGSKDLTTPTTEGFESYPAVVNFADDADPGGSWVTSEVAGSGSGMALDPLKIQVVDSTVVAPHSGSKCLKLEGGQQAGVSYAWGSGPEQDVEITWWARVPESTQGATANYLRMSLYGVEGGRADQGDAALLGYGSRDGTIGDGTSLTVFTTAWRDSQINYTPDTWEEYRLRTNNAAGTYSIVKGPGSATPETIADNLGYIGSAATWGPMFMVAFSSSNGAGHPPVYVDDITVKSISAGTVEPPVVPYTVAAEGTRFTSSTIIHMPGPVGGAAVDPRDPTTIVATIDSINGALYQVKQNASTKAWELDPTPLVNGLSNPSGLVIDNEGTLWWTHDFTQSLRRLKAPWRDNTQETMISGFGASADDDPIDLTLTGSAFNGALGKPGNIVVADRDMDALGQRGLYFLDPAAITPNQTAFSDILTGPTTELGSAALNAITYLPATGEVVTVNNDETIALTNADGSIRTLTPTTVFSYLAGAAADPQTGRLWLADRDLAEIWSVSPAAVNPGDDRREVSFNLIDETRPERQISFNDPGLKFSPDGSILLVSDSSLQNRGGWLTILSGSAAVNPPGPVTITRVEHTPQGVTLGWTPLGTSKYRVLRSTSLSTPFQDISGELTTPLFTDPQPPAGRAFYKVSSTP
ncbi:MAG: hypothetical protein V4726_15505 [Verrucomicrobiota bacterium]